jgi:hypothetical protein
VTPVTNADDLQPEPIPAANSKTVSFRYKSVIVTLVLGIVSAGTYQYWLATRPYKSPELTEVAAPLIAALREGPAVSLTCDAFFGAMAKDGHGNIELLKSSESASAPHNVLKCGSLAGLKVDEVNGAHIDSRIIDIHEGAFGFSALDQRFKSESFEARSTQFEDLALSIRRINQREAEKLSLAREEEWIAEAKARIAKESWRRHSARASQ